MSNNHLTDTSFNQLAIPPVLISALEHYKFEKCTPIQEKSLPVALKNHDVIGKAQTGTGKTIAFLVAMFARLHSLDEQNSVKNSNQDSHNDKNIDDAVSSENNDDENLTVEDASTAKVDTLETKQSDKSNDDVETGNQNDDQKHKDDASDSAELANESTDKSSVDNANSASKNTRKKTPRALIIAPTRELALQIYKDARKLNRNLHYKIGLAYGGNNYKKQQAVVEKGVDIIIGTPGRIIDFNKQGLLRFNNIEVLVMDEADRMFDLGFLKDIRFLLNRLPDANKRLNMLFSATISFDVEELAYEQMNQPSVIEIESNEKTETRIDEQLFYPASDEKLSLLKFLIDKHDMQRVIVFINTKHVGEIVAKTLIQLNHKAGVISGDIAQNKREQLLDDFRKGQVQVLVATDVAARGIHIDDVDFVVNYDLPNQAEDYVHRIGRTARAGASGHAISFACEQYSFILPEIEEFINHKIPTQTIDNDELKNIDIPNIKVHRKDRNKSTSKAKPNSKSKLNSKSKPNSKSNYTKEASTNDNNNYSRSKKPDEIITVETPVIAQQANLENRWFSRHGYEIPAFG